MKSLKFLAATALFAGALIQQAAATTQHIYITGSTSFRSGAINAIAAAVHLPNTGTSGGNGFGGGTGNDTTYVNPAPPSGTGAKDTENTSFIWEGGFIFNNGVSGATTSVTVCATFTGSQTGVCTCLGSQAIPFLPDGSTGTNNASCYQDGQAATPNTTTFGGVYPTTVLAIPDMAFSDVFQALTSFAFTNKPVTLGTPFNTSVTFPNGVDNQVAFCTFKLVGSKGFPLGTGSSSVNEGTIYGTGYAQSSYSVEPNALTALFTGGSIPMSMITGNPSNPGDQTTQIFATGRNPDSGTRGTLLADTGIGNGTTLFQYRPTLSGTAPNQTVASHTGYPIEYVAGINTTTVGNSGQATGGVLRTYMVATLPTSGLTDEGSDITAAYYITILGTGDAANTSNSVKGNAVELCYKGTAFSVNAVYQGSYTLWSIEHLYNRSTIAGLQAGLKTALVNGLNTTASASLSQAGLSNQDSYVNNGGPFQVARSSDGGAITVQFNP